MRHTGSIVALLVFAGCVVSHEARPESGSRIRAVWLRPSSGEPIFWRWHDTERDVDCGFVLTSDGPRRCLPISTRLYRAEVVPPETLIALERVVE